MSSQDLLSDSYALEEGRYAKGVNSRMELRGRLDIISKMDLTFDLYNMREGVEKQNKTKKIRNDLFLSCFTRSIHLPDSNIGLK